MCIRAAEIYLSQEAVHRPAQQGDLVHGTALVTAQALTSIGRLHTRLRLLDSLTIPMNSSTAALCVGSTRPAATTARKRPRPQPEQRARRRSSAPRPFDLIGRSGRRRLPLLKPKVGSHQPRLPQFV